MLWCEGREGERKLVDWEIVVGRLELNGKEEGRLGLGEGVERRVGDVGKRVGRARERVRIGSGEVVVLVGLEG